MTANSGLLLPMQPSFNSFQPNALPPPALPVEGSQESDIGMHAEVSDGVFRQFCRLFPQTSYELVVSILREVAQIRSGLNPVETKVIEGSDVFPYKIYVNENFFQVGEKQIGKGAIGSISCGPIIHFDVTVHSGDLFTRVSKVRKVNMRHQGPSFSPVKRLIDRVRESVSPTKQRSIASYTHTSRLNTGHATATMDLYEGTHFAGTKFSNASELIRNFGQFAYALSGYHANDVIHRDLKEANVLVTPEYPVIIDPDLAVSCDREVGIIGTPGYMNPVIHGRIPEKSLLKQRENAFGRGKMNPMASDDMYAFSVMGLRCIQRYLAGEAEEYIGNDREKRAEVSGAFTKMNQKIISPSRGDRFSEREIDNYGKQYGFDAYDYRFKRSGPEKVAVHPRREEYLSSLRQVLKIYNLPQEETQQIINFAELCQDIRTTLGEEHDALTVSERCQHILTGDEQVIGGGVSSSSSSSSSNHFERYQKEWGHLTHEDMLASGFTLARPLSKKCRVSEERSSEPVLIPPSIRRKIESEVSSHSTFRMPKPVADREERSSHHEESDSNISNLSLSMSL